MYVCMYVCMYVGKMREMRFFFLFFFFFSIIPARFQPDLPHGPISIEL